MVFLDNYLKKNFSVEVLEYIYRKIFDSEPPESNMVL